MEDTATGIPGGLEGIVDYYNGALDRRQALALGGGDETERSMAAGRTFAVLYVLAELGAVPEFDAAGHITAIAEPRGHWPVCVGIDEAAAYAGVAPRVLREWVHDKVDPLPHIEVGKRKLVYIDGIAPWIERTKVLQRR